MATIEPPNLRKFASAWESHIDTARKRNDAATLSGIVGDTAHRREGGYHISIEDLPDPGRDYSNQLDADRKGQRNFASAVDMTMGPADMKLVTQRVEASWKDPNDPRLDYCRGINGWLGTGAAVRFDCQAGTRDVATDDHKWHVHWEFLRMYANDPKAHAAALSVIKGETVAQWRAGGGIEEGEDMFSEADRKTLNALANRIHAMMQGSPTLANDLSGAKSYYIGPSNWQTANEKRFTGLGSKLDALTAAQVQNAARDAAASAAMNAQTVVMKEVLALLKGTSKADLSPIIERLDKLPGQIEAAAEAAGDKTRRELAAKIDEDDNEAAGTPQA